MKVLQCDFERLIGMFRRSNKRPAVRQLLSCLRASSARRPVLLCLPALIYLSATIFTHQRGDDGPTGDEPSYLQVAESIVSDADVNLDNNHERFGPHPKDSHCVQRDHGWFSVHNIGLAALVALPATVGGPIGARLMLALFAGLVAPVLYRVMNAIWNQPRGSCMMALALALGMPLVHASSQIYPDLPAGILVLVLAAEAMAAEDECTTLNWCPLLAPGAVAILPWLHIKYAAPALVACLWCAFARPWRRSSLSAAALVASLAILGWYNWYAFGKPTGPYAHGRALHAGLNSFIVFMGLHFDQAQGMFLQQPLWLLGLIGLAPMWRASRRNCLFWALLYAAAILPNSMHPNWYGGCSFIGRFGATAVLLWAIPVAYAARTLFAADLRVPTALVVASLTVQLCLACNWLAGGENLLNHCERPDLWRPCIWAYNGFFPHWVRDYLPYWQPYLTFWRYPANFSALVVAGGLVIGGFSLPRRRSLAWGCLLGTPVLAASVAAALPARVPKAACAGDQLPESVGALGHRAEAHRVAREGVDAQGPLTLVHGFFPRPGDYRVAVDFQAQAKAGEVGHVMFHDGKSLTLLSTLNSGGGHQRSVGMLHVPRSKAQKLSSIIVWYTGRGTLSIARLEVGRHSR